MTERTRFTEFPEFADDEVPALPVGWRDSSWKNDCAPSYIAPFGEGVVRVWMDRANIDDREVPVGSRFTVVDPDSDVELRETDDWDDVLRFVANGPTLDRSLLPDV